MFFTFPKRHLLVAGFLIGTAVLAPPAARSDVPIRPDHVPGVDFSLRKTIFGEGSQEPAGFSLCRPGRWNQAETKTDLKVEAGSPKKRWGRAILEFGSLFSFSAVSYWIRYAQFIEDWQYELTCRDQYKRFFTTEALKFDSNSFRLNWSHGVAGGVYYQFFRTNYLTWLESRLGTLAASLLWEYGVEWREVVSISDNVFTGLGGYPLGEAWFQLGHFLNTQPQLVLRALGFLNPFLKLNRWLDRKNPASKSVVYPGWHAFELSVGARWLSGSGGEILSSLYVSLETEIVNPPEYGRPGEVRRTIRDIFSSEISLDLATGGNQGLDDAFVLGWTEEDLVKGRWVDEINFRARVVNWARFSQRIDELSRGSSLAVGLGSAFSFFRKMPLLKIDTGRFKVRMGDDLQLDKGRYFRDKFSTVHLAGPVLDWTYFGRDLKLRGIAEAYLDFSLVNSFALNEYSYFFDISGMKTTLLHYGYYYAIGISLLGRTELVWRGFRIQGLASFQAFESIEGLDRFQADITDDFDLDDSRFRYLVGIDWRLSRLPLRIFCKFEGIRRWGRLHEIEVRSLEKRVFAGLVFFF